MNRQVDVKALVSHIIRGDGLDKCRICMGETTLGQVHLGDTVMMDGDMSVTLSELLELITGVTIETSPWLPARVCQACLNPIINFIPAYLLCRESAQKWNQTADYLSTVSVNKQATTAYILLGDKPQVLADRSTTKNKTAKEVISNVRRRLIYFRKAQKDKLKSAVPKRTAPPKLACPDCNKGGYGRLLEFNFHLNTNMKHCCPYCYSIMDIREYGQHLRTHDKLSFECGICHLHFDTEKRLLRHKRYHKRGKFVCSECKYTFPTMLRLSVHTNLVHATIRCACDKVFYGKICYNNHIRICPRKRAQNYICDYCSKEFKLKCIVKQHIQNYHLSRNCEQCNICGKTFKNKAHLKEHSYMHDVVLDRFSCDFCGKKYCTPRGYRKHMTKSHYEVDPELYKRKKYPCSVCSKVLLSETNLKNHMLKKHKAGI